MSCSIQMAQPTLLYEAESPAMVLIRPDGYIGFRGGARHADALREHLALIFFAPPETEPQIIRSGAN